MEAVKQAGNEHLASGEHVAALRCYTEAIELAKGRDHTLFSNRSFAFTKLGQYARAILDADAAIQLAPHWAKGYFRRGEGYRLCGLPEQALQAYRVASRLDPSDAHLVACCASATAELRQAERRSRLFIGAGLAIGLSLAVVLIASEAATKGAVHSVASIGLVALSLCVLGALSGVAARELWRHQLASRAAAPSMPNDAFVRYQFSDMRAPKGWNEATGGGGDETDDGTIRRSAPRRRPTSHKSFRNRTAAPPGRPPGTASL